MKRIAFYGGSFNPPHFSHLLAATWALATGEVDRVWMAPCAEHAFGKELAPFQHRLEMCRLLTRPFREVIEVTDIENRPRQTPYTLETLQFILERHSDIELRLLVGTDILEEKEAWYRFDEVEKLAPLLVVPRPSSHSSSKKIPTLPDISSRKIRELLATEKETAPYLPRPIFDYIQRHHLYQNSK